MPLVLNSSSITGLAAVGGLSSPQTGSVLQVVQGVSTTSTTISAGPTDTTLTATITPTSATSKILIIVNQIVYLYGGGGDSGFQLFILKNGSTIYNNISHSLYISSSSGNPELITNYPITYLDSPATTSALTYKTQATATAAADEQTANISLTLQDLIFVAQIIQLSSQRGAFRAEELANVGALYNKLVAFLQSTGALTPAENAPTEEKK